MMDPLYRSVREASNSHTLKAWLFFEKIQSAYGQFLGSDPRDRAPEAFFPVWWELYLAFALDNAHIPLLARAVRSHPAKGPDLLAENPRVWVEAVMPERGSGPDELREPRDGHAFTVPVDDFVLRLRTAVDAKITRLTQYIDDGTIPAGDAAIIAISGGSLPVRFSEGPTPNIVRALFGVGSSVLEIDPKAKKIVGRSVEHRDHVLKKSGSPVHSGPFLRNTSAHISAVIYSSADCVNHPEKPGDDFVLVHNPKATVPIHHGWLPIGTEYWIDESSATLNSRNR